MKDLDYQPDQLQADQLVLPKWIEVKKDSFHGIQIIGTKAKKNKLKTSVNKEVIMVNNMEELIKDIVSGKIKQQYTKDRFNTIVESNVNKRNVNSWFKKIYKKSR